MFLLCSCVWGESGTVNEPTPPAVSSDVAVDEQMSFMGIAISPSDKSVMDLATRVYDDQELSEIAIFEGSIEELNAAYPIECLRELDAEGSSRSFRAVYLGDGKVVSRSFDESGNSLGRGSVLTLHLMKADFDGLEEGQLLRDVRELDPDGVYPFYYTGSPFPIVSRHYTEDGYGIFIEYDQSETYWSHIQDTPIVSIDVQLL